VEQGKLKSLTPSEGGKSPSLIIKPGDTKTVDVSAVSGVPRTLTTHETKPSLKRTVQIVIPPKSAMQSGVNNACHIELTFDRNQEKWENPLMGWTSSRDTMQAVSIRFGRVEEARRFAERQGWDVEIVGVDEVVEGARRRETATRPKSYADNFKYSKGKLKTIPTK
jgi:NADH dehydrogenase (ubiquinone) Fe-S protein 4